MVPAKHRITKHEVMGKIDELIDAIRGILE